MVDLVVLSLLFEYMLKVFIMAISILPILFS